MVIILHFLAGSSAPVRGSDVVAVIDLDGKITTPDTADFLRRAERAGITTLAGDNLPKCAVLLAPPRRRARRSRSRRRPLGGTRLIFSTTSAAALNRRSQLPHGGVQ